MKANKDDPTGKDAGNFHLGFPRGALVRRCPFCEGRELRMNNTHTPSYWIECEDCGGALHGRYGPDIVGGRYGSLAQHAASRDDALRRWNTRPEPCGWITVFEPAGFLGEEQDAA